MPNESGRTRLVLLFGGVSAEHDVSRASASSVLGAIDADRYEIQPVGISKTGEWLFAEDALRALSAGPAGLPESLAVAGAALEPLPTVTPVDAHEQVVVLPLLHGPRGEDGTVQGMLELADVPYVGSGVLGSALCMDKVASKAATALAGIPQARYVAARDADVDDAFRARVADELGFPVFVKPANLGSSVGVSKASDDAELRASIDVALSFDEWVIVEEAVDAREIEVGVIGNAQPRASVPGEIVPTHDFYDYDDKYLAGAAEMVIPADLPPEVIAEAQRLAVESYKTLRCDGLGRVDFFYESPGRGLLLNEINTMPGFTKYSMFPSLWEATGLPYGELIDELIRLALERHHHRAAHRRAQP
ncbi:MAG TPA: D-alanine--D-alanine ligase family protein [Acidimicrobiales bacterium]